MYYITAFMGIDENHPDKKISRVIYELKLLIVILAFFKSMFFVRIFEGYGFFV
jgi:hypothetical protein